MTLPCSPNYQERSHNLPLIIKNVHIILRVDQRQCLNDIYMYVPFHCHQVDVNQSTVKEEQIQLPVEEKTLFEGYCPLLFNISGTWTTEIKFNISNDGFQFTDTYNVIIYQSQCQEYHNQSGEVFFTLKVNYPTFHSDNVTWRKRYRM